MSVADVEERKRGLGWETIPPHSSSLLFFFFFNIKVLLLFRASPLKEYTCVWPCYAEGTWRLRSVCLFDLILKHSHASCAFYFHSFFVISHIILVFQQFRGNVLFPSKADADLKDMTKNAD